MARPPKQAQLITYDEQEDVSDVFETVPQNEGQTSQKKKLEDILADLRDTNDDSEIRVFRQSPLGGKAPMAYLCSFPVDKYTLSELYEMLRDKYGGGEYRIHVRVNGSLQANKLVQIEAPADKPDSKQGDTAEILKAVMDRQEKMMNVLLHRDEGGSSRKEFFEELMLMKNFFAPPVQSAPVNAIEQLATTVTLLKELGVNIGGGDSEPGFGALLEKMAPVIQTVVSRQPQQPASVEAGYKPNPTEPRQPQQTSQQGNDMFLKMGINTLLKGAEKQSDPATYAEMILDQLPVKAVQEFLTSQNSFAKLVEVNPRCLEFRPWFEDLGEHCKAHLGLESKFSHLYDDEESAITGETIDDENPASDDKL